jgi:hypothetical protein
MIREKRGMKKHTSGFEGEADASDLYQLFGTKGAGLKVTVCQDSVVTTRLQTAWWIGHADSLACYHESRAAKQSTDIIAANNIDVLP